MSNNADTSLTWQDFVLDDEVREAIEQLPEELKAMLYVEPLPVLALVDVALAKRAAEFMTAEESSDKVWSAEEISAVAGAVLESGFQNVAAMCVDLDGSEIDEWRPPTSVLVLARLLVAGAHIEGFTRLSKDADGLENAKAELLAAFQTEDDARAVTAAEALVASGGELLEFGPNTPAPLLHLAAASNMCAFVAYLLDQVQFDLRIKDNDQWNVLDAAVRAGALDTARLLGSRGLRPKADLKTVAGFGDPELVDAIRTLAILDPDELTSTDELGFTPLHHARHPEIARVLLEAGAPVDAVNDRGVTPLHVAVMNEYPIETVERLIGAGAPVDAAKADGFTVLGWATIFSKVKAVECLLRHGARPDYPGTSDGETPLQLARKSSNPDLHRAFGLPPISRPTSPAPPPGKSTPLAPPQYVDAEVRREAENLRPTGGLGIWLVGAGVMACVVLFWLG